MDEFKFVCKCFVFAAILVALSQIKTNGYTVEAHVHSALSSSQTADFVNKAAHGGVKLIRDSIETSVKKFNDWRYDSAPAETRKTASIKIAPAVQTQQAPAVQQSVETAKPEEENLTEEF